MKNKINLLIKLLTISALLANYKNGNAQGKSTALKTGDAFLKISTINSASTLKRGDVAINISSKSSVSKTYNIDAVNANGFAVTMNTKKITDSVSSGNDHFYYDSDQPANNTDNLANALQFTVNQPSTFNVYNGGTIGTVDDNVAKLQNDSLFNFTGIEQENLAAGERFSLIADITSYDKLKTGDNWADTTSAEGDKTITKFWVITRTPLSTTLGYSSESRGKQLNSNASGTYVINNSNGVVTRRIIQSVTVGYQIYKRAVYSSTRRTNITESCYAMK